MAPPHWHHAAHHCHPSSSSSSSSCCCSCSAICHSSPTTACQPLPSATDPLLQCLAAHLLQSIHHLPPPQQHHQYQHHHLPQKHPQPKPYHHRRQYQTDSLEEQTYVDSLIQRIASLESSLAAPPAPPRPETSQKGTRTTRHRPNRVSLRDIAARTIQTQFRLYLVHRSRTLRHLRDLAIVRSHVADLKSLIPIASVSQRAMDLLLHLDSIQSQDQMIREGKKTIAEELVGILEVSNNGVWGKRRELSLASKGKMGPLQLEQHSKPSVRRPGVFAEGGDGKVLSSNSSSDAGKEEEEVIYEGGSSRVSEDDGGDGAEEQGKGGEVSIAALGNRRNGMVGVGSSSSSSSSLGQQKWIPQLGLYAPLPVHMESRRTELS